MRGSSAHARARAPGERFRLTVARAEPRLQAMVRRGAFMLKRSRNKVVAGICGGVAEHLGWSPGRTRLVYALLSVLSAGFPGVLLYLALWFLMPPPAASAFRLEDFRQQ